MTRITISLDERDKSWLEQKARQEGESMAEIVRTAVSKVRNIEENNLDRVLTATRGVWRDGGSLRYQRRLRREWR